MTSHAIEHEHPPPIHYSSRISPSVLGMFLFIASEIMLFGAFFTVYFFDRVVNHGVEIGGIYWHFVDVMWIVVYVTVYLL